jgi:predicted HTH domain antitoxin
VNLLKEMMKILQKRGNCPEYGKETGENEAKRAEISRSLRKSVREVR